MRIVEGRGGRAGGAAVFIRRNATLVKVKSVPQRETVRGEEETGGEGGREGS